MSLSPLNNSLQVGVQRSLFRTQMQLDKAIQRLSSGLRLNSAADDPAAMSVSANLTAQIGSYNQAIRNVNDGISMYQTIDGGMGQVANILTNLREIAVQASNGTLSSNDRTNLNTTFSAAVSDISNIAAGLSFNGISLLNSNSTVTLQIGIGTAATVALGQSFSSFNVTTTSLAISANSVSSVANAQTAITALDLAINSVSGNRATAGSILNRLTNTVQNLQTTVENLTAANDGMKNADFAAETSRLTSNQILVQTAQAMLAQINSLNNSALQLLQR